MVAAVAAVLKENAMVAVRRSFVLIVALTSARYVVSNYAMGAIRGQARAVCSTTLFGAKNATKSVASTVDMMLAARIGMIVVPTV